MSVINRKFILIFLYLLGFYACKNELPNNENINHDKEAVDSIVLESKAKNKENRAAWQKPDFVISKLGDLKGKTVADIGSGLGYFTFRLAFKANKVIGIDIDAEMIKSMNILKDNLPENIQNKIEARLAKPSDPMLEPEEVDCAIIVNTIAYIDNRVAYFKNLKKGLQKGGMLMIMDFKMKKLPQNVAPPIENRVHLYQLENELTAAGYDQIVSDDRSLDYQYIIFAFK